MAGGLMKSLKALTGDLGRLPEKTLPSGTTAIQLGSSEERVVLNATATVTIASIGQADGTVRPGRRITLIPKTGTSAITFTLNAGSTTAGQIDGGSNVTAGSLTFDDGDVIELVQLDNGVWLIASRQVNVIDLPGGVFATEHTVTSAEAALNSADGQVDIVTGFAADPSVCFVSVIDASTDIQNTGYAITYLSGANLGTVRIKGINAGIQLDENDRINFLAIKNDSASL